MEYNLSQSGIKGMKWGIRRFQNKDGSLTPAGRKRYNSDGDDDSTETLEQKKERIRSSHSAKELYKNKDLFSDKELQDAYIRLNTERNLKNLIPEEVSRGQRYLNNYTNMSKTVKSIVDSSSDLYSSYMKGKDLLEKILKK